MRPYSLFVLRSAHSTYVLMCCNNNRGCNLQQSLYCLLLNSQKRACLNVCRIRTMHRLRTSWQSAAVSRWLRLPVLPLPQPRPLPPPLPYEDGLVATECVPSGGSPPELIRADEIAPLATREPYRSTYSDIHEKEGGKPTWLLHRVRSVHLSSLGYLLSSTTGTTYSMQ